MCNLVVWLAPEHYFGGLPLESLRWALLLLLIAGSATFWLLFWPLKRVEADGEYLYITNYFKTARYRWDNDIVGLKEYSILLLRFGVLELKHKGAFGKAVRFIVAKRLLTIFEETYPGIVVKKK